MSGERALKRESTSSMVGMRVSVDKMDCEINKRQRTRKRK